MIEFKNVSKSFDRILFENFSFKFEDHGFYLIKGKSGLGKSTILNMIAGLDKNYEGEILFNNASLKKFNEIKMRKYRMNEIGFIFQSFNLFENDTVLNNILISLNTLNISKKEKDYKLYEILSKLGLLKLKDTLVNKLSGGEKQRVALARSLIKSPKILLADEPTGALDFKNSKKIFKILKSISKDILVIVVTHDEYFSSLYGSNVLEFKDNNILYNYHENNHNPSFRVLNFKNKYKRKYDLSLKFMFNRFKESLQSNKKMNYFIISMCSFSLMLFGLTLTIKNQMGNLIIESFSSFCGENSLILESKLGNNEIEDYYGASKEDIINLYKTYDGIDEIGAYYLNDFNNFFIEANDVYFENQFNSLIKIPMLNMNNFINYTYVENLNSINTISKINDKVSKNSIILGIDNKTMLEVTNNLRIKSTYNSLNNFLFNYNPYIILKVQNDYWTYDDEILIDLAGITQSSSNTIYSSKLFYNEYLLEDIMRFPSSLEISKEYEYPWVLKKLYYFQSKNKEEVIKEISLSNLYDELEFDSSFVLNKTCLMHSIKNGLKENDIDLINNYFNINSYYYSSNFGYINFGSIMSGFSKPTFISSSMSELENLIDKKNNLEFEDYYYLENNDKFLRGNYLINNKDKVTFSSDFSNKISGKYPSNYNSIAISKGIADKFNLKIGSEIHFGTFTKIKDENKKTAGEFNIASFKITGIVSNKNYVLYQDGYFSISLYRDIFNVSPYNLGISNITFFLDNKIEEDAIEKFNIENPEYLLSSPILEIENTLNESLKIISIILSIFSFFALISSIILLTITTLIKFIKSKKESAILVLLGFSNYEIFRNSFYSNLFLNLIGFIFSLFSLSLGNFSLSKIINKMIGGESIFIIDIKSILILLLIIILISFISSIFLIFKIKKININHELHH